MLNHWQEHKDQLHRYIAKRVDPPHIVDDILQDVYLKAHTNLHQLKTPGSISGWLYRIAYNAIMDDYRKHRSFDELPDDLVAEESDGLHQAHQELALCLQPLIEELPELYRSSLQMVESEGLSQKQVAERLDLSISGAKSRIQRGRAQLRERLTECCDIEIGHGGVVDYQIKERQSCNRC